MVCFGGQMVDFNFFVIQFGCGELLEDMVRVFSCYCDVLVICIFVQQELVDYVYWVLVLVINVFIDLEYFCQVLVDFFIMQEVYGVFFGQILVYVGDGNNVVYFLMLGGVLLGVNVWIGCFEGFEFLLGVFEQV